MNLREDLEKIENDTDDDDSIIQRAINEQEELAKKIYLLKVLSLAKNVEELTKTDLFSKDGIEFIQITYDYDDDNFRLEFYLLDQDSEIIAGYYDAHDHEQSEALMEIFEKIYPLNLEFINPSLKGNAVNIELKPGIKDSIIRSLLNNELKKLYDYNKMQIELPESNESNPKKMKM